MDRAHLEDYLIQTELHLTECEWRAERQRTLVDRLKENGGREEFITLAENILRQFEELQALLIKEHDLVKRELARLTQ